MSANTTAPNPSALVSRPTTSSPGTVMCARVSGTTRIAPMMTAIPIGMLTRKIQGHVNDVVSQPPRSGPTAAMPEITAPQMPNATARSLPRNVALTVDRVAGRTNAPPTPWIRRATIRVPASSAWEARMLPPRKTTTPTRSRLRRPSRSPRRPAVSSSAANTTE
ncbi:hypothetical protein D3C74_352260 [compost metagenome]